MAGKEPLQIPAEIEMYEKELKQLLKKGGKAKRVSYDDINTVFSDMELDDAQFDADRKSVV